MNYYAILAGACACLGPLLVGLGTGSFVAMLGAFLISGAIILPWCEVKDIVVNEQRRRGLQAVRVERDDES